MLHALDQKLTDEDKLDTVFILKGLLVQYKRQIFKTKTIHFLSSATEVWMKAPGSLKKEKIGSPGEKAKSQGGLAKQETLDLGPER